MQVAYFLDSANKGTHSVHYISAGNNETAYILYINYTCACTFKRAEINFKRVAKKT